MRTQKEIVEKIKEVESDDWMGTTRNDLIDFLDFDHAKEFLEDGVTPEQFGVAKENTPENIKSIMKDYLGFAFGKAEDGRGLSAGRSMDHYYAWIWLLGEEERFGDVRIYDSYGLPHLNALKSFLED